MASNLPVRMKPISFAIASRRMLSSQATTALRRTNSSLRPQKAQSLPRPVLQQSFRRTYAENAAPKVVLSPTPAPKKRFRFFRFLWRATYLSVIAGTGYLAYTIWDGRNPEDQFEPDSSKKTLVVLGL